MEIVNNDYRIQAVLGRLETVIDNENARIGKELISISNCRMPIRAAACMN